MVQLSNLILVNYIDTPPLIFLIKFDVSFLTVLAFLQYCLLSIGGIPMLILATQATLWWD
jgi:hypothetical protein